MSASYPYHHPSNTPDKRRARAAHAGSAPKINQRGVRLSERDEAALETLFFTDWMDIDDLWRLHYAGAAFGTCANRLNKIYSDGSGQLSKTVVVLRDATAAAPSQVPSQVTFYALSDKGRARVARRLEREGLGADDLFADGRPAEYSERGVVDPPHPEMVGRLLEVSEIYVVVAGYLRSHLGRPGPETWFWRNERRARLGYGLGSGYYVYRPDAELVIAIPESARSSRRGELSYAHLLIEVPTAAHGGARDVEEKVGAFARAFPRSGGGSTRDRHAFAHGSGQDPTPNRWSLYIATARPDHADAATGAASRLGLRHCWSEDTRSIAQRIAAHALDPMSYLS